MWKWLKHKYGFCELNEELIEAMTNAAIDNINRIISSGTDKDCPYSRFNWNRKYYELIKVVNNE
jgi:hypothetical protein